MNDIIIKIKKVNKIFPLTSHDLHVLKDIDLEVSKGEFLVLMGQSGSGKSTLLYLMGGLDEMTSGSIHVLGHDISKLDDQTSSFIRRNHVGFIFQSYNLVENLTVEENILLPILLEGKKKKDVQVELEEILKAVGLEDRRYHTPRELSGGQQQRTAIARALINKPDILFADEPTGNLDSKTSEEILALLDQINKERKITIVMITHSPTAAAFGSRNIHMEDGRLFERQVKEKIG